MPNIAPGSPAKDPRHIANGSVIPSVNYADQPYVVILPDRSWLAVMTTGAGEEGAPGQHVVAARSFDRGATWNAPVAIEPPDGPEASWCVPLLVPGIGGPLGRVYAFYVYNIDNMRRVIADDEYAAARVDTLGAYMFRYSDDGGETWSADRYEVPVREFEIDRNNPYQGKVRFFWGVSKPLTEAGNVYIGLHKVGSFGEGFMASSEGCFLVSDNILTESNPASLRWATLPDGDVGLRATSKPVADEHNITALSDGTLFCTYRTTEGHSCHAYSSDGGHTWTPRAHMTYGPGRRKIKHPRAANFVRRFSNGRFLYWFHNHGNAWYEGRNPVWLVGGEEIDTPDGKRIAWSEPEIVLYDDDLASRMSYPDFIEDDGQFFVTETQKVVARVHPISTDLLGWLWEGPHRAVPAAAPAAQWAAGEASVTMPQLPGLWRERRGFSIDFSIRFDDLASHQTMFDSTGTSGDGVTITLTERGVLKLTLQGPTWSETCYSTGNSVAQSAWDCDAGILQAGREHQVTVIVDAGPKVILWVIDGQLCDGGTQRSFGWGRFHPNLDNVNGESVAQVASTLRGRLSHLAVYDRALLVNEAAAAHRARK
ncbi:MAG TPA: exo-alpha-sialidase [Capsulimonadaceae bacterium]|jgi:hypothetical protein